jgi:hypothetical protein
MSMDLEVWSEGEPRLPDMLITPREWIAYGTSWAYERDEWQVIVVPKGVQAIVPPAVLHRLPNARYRIGVTLEPMDADEAGFVMFEAVIRGLATRMDGVWINPDGDVLTATEI